MGLFGIPLTLASFAALLMLVGFSLDTDVLLTMRVIKRKEKDPRSRAYEAMKTGMTMSMALFVSFACLFVLASITHINTYYEISSVALVGLVGDMIATWLLNAILVLNYAEKHSHGDTERGMLSSLFSG
jgi:preprotein translocase subunit SecF